MSVKPHINAALLSLFFVTASEASMSDQTISGKILDQRITACGVRVSGEEMAALRPFIETSADVSGTFRVTITKKSASGTSMINQGNAFSAGKLGNVILAVDRPSKVSIHMTVSDTTGKPLCELDGSVELQAPEIRT